MGTAGRIALLIAIIAATLYFSKKWDLYFTVYDPVKGSRIIFDGAYYSRHSCIDASFGKKRREYQAEYPSAAISAYCVPKNVRKTELMKRMGWH